MKLETKRRVYLKLMWWVKRVIGYYEYNDPTRLYVVMERHRIQLIRYQQAIPNKELLMVSDDQINYMIRAAIAEKLLEVGALNIKREPAEFDKNITLITAKVQIVTPYAYTPDNTELSKSQAQHI